MGNVPTVLELVFEKLTDTNERLNNVEKNMVANYILIF